MLNLIEIKNQWKNQGFCIFPNFIDTKKLEKLFLICDDIFNQWLATSPNIKEAANTTNMAYLTEPIYFDKYPKKLIELLEFIADQNIIEILEFISGEKILFHNTQYFFNPADKSWKGIWHRDTQFLAPEPELEKQRIKYNTGVHFRVAFLPDDYLEYVPASEQRWDTPEEYAIRKGENGKSNIDDDMPGKQKIFLNPGDALLFHAWGIHRGVYDMNKPRRTLDIIYSWGNHCDYYVPPMTCFEQSDLLDKLSLNARDFFSYFIKTYQQYWEKI
ncbi:MAG: phytanoyl-CoA dioxygenase family protein [Okeania sp. SIO3B3]|nr:phytanoyl-CoA dioxygenase family protein [Okeania sp. SIO3B3]